jgi:hypothetical protein
LGSLECGAPACISGSAPIGWKNPTCGMWRCRQRHGGVGCGRGRQACGHVGRQPGGPSETQSRLCPECTTTPHGNPAARAGFGFRFARCCPQNNWLQQPNRPEQPWGAPRSTPSAQ